MSVLFPMLAIRYIELHFVVGYMSPVMSNQITSSYSSPVRDGQDSEIVSIEDVAQSLEEGLCARSSKEMSCMNV